MRSGCTLRTLALPAIAACVVSGSAPTAFAKSDGYISASGKSGTYCRNHHAGGTAPTVSFTGPGWIRLGTTEIFRFTVTSHSAGQPIAGFDVAASAGTLGLAPGAGTRLQSNEVTHSEPKPVDADGDAVFEFTWKAPATSGTYTLFGAGLSANGNEQQNGDGAAKTEFQVAVGDVPPTPTPTTELPTATPTPTTASPAATATPTVAATPCVGDCGEDGEVTVEELVTGVNIALGTTSLSACPAFNANGDGEVTVEELVQGVNNALVGCTTR